MPQVDQSAKKAPM